MGIRMGSSQFMNNYQVALNNAYQKQAKLYEQADGMSIHRPSDNPIDYSKFLRYKINENENEQYRANIDTATSWMNNSDAVMIHITEIMKTIEEKSVQAANDDNTQADCAAIYKEMFADMQELISAGNTQVGDRYLFAGQKDLTQPFQMSVEEVKRGLPKTLDIAQASFFRGTSTENNGKLIQMLTMEARDDSGNVTGYYYVDSYTDPETKELKTRVYTKEFVDEGYKKLIMLGYDSFDEAEIAALSDTTIHDLVEKGKPTYINFDNSVYDHFSIANYFDNRGQLKDESVNSLTVDNSIETLYFTMIDQRIVSYHGDEELISMVKLNGAPDASSDTVNSTGARMFGTDIFDNEDSGNETSGTAMLNEILCVCSKVQAGDIKWMSSDGVTITDVAHSTLLVEETRIGARRQLFNNVKTMLETHADNITESINNVSGTDVARLATKLMELTTLYNMSLSIGGRILPQSLADYL